MRICGKKIENSEHKNSYKIVDKTTGLDNFSCPSGLEEIYLDNDYILFTMYKK